MGKRKVKRIASSDPLPHVAAALICEKVLEEKDRVVSAMRIVDTIGVAIHPDSKKEMDAGKPGMVPLPFTLFICFRVGDAKKDKTCEIYITGPSKKRTRMGGGELTLKGQEPGHGINIFVPLQILWDGYGLYWFDIMVNGNLMTKIPLHFKNPETDKAVAS